MPWDLTSNSLMILLEGNTCFEKKSTGTTTIANK